MPAAGVHPGLGDRRGRGRRLRVQPDHREVQEPRPGPAQPEAERHAHDQRRLARHGAAARSPTAPIASIAAIMPTCPPLRRSASQPREQPADDADRAAEREGQPGQCGIEAASRGRRHEERAIEPAEPAASVPAAPITTRAPVPRPRVEPRTALSWSVLSLSAAGLAVGVRRLVGGCGGWLGRYDRHREQGDERARHERPSPADRQRHVGTDAPASSVRQRYGGLLHAERDALPAAAARAGPATRCWRADRARCRDRRRRAEPRTGSRYEWAIAPTPSRLADASTIAARPVPVGPYRSTIRPAGTEANALTAKYTAMAAAQAGG